MSQLRPEIKRLLIQARPPAEPGEEAAPFGFAARVVAQARLTPVLAMLPLQRIFSTITWVSALVIVSCSVVLMQHRRADDPAIAIVDATQQFARTISP